MGSNYIIDKSFQMMRTNPTLTTNFKIVVSSEYKLYLESIPSHPMLSNDKYKHFSFSKEKYLEDIIPEFYDGLPINIAFYTKDDDDEDIVYTDYKHQFDTLYWSGVGKVVDNNFFEEEFEYFAPLYIDPNDLPGGFVVLRIDEPGVYELFEGDKKISNTNKNNFRKEFIDKWKCVSYFDMTNTTIFGEWLKLNYTDNMRFPKSSLEFDSKTYNFTRWYGINYTTGVYTYKSLYVEDKLRYENPHFKLEEFLIDGFKNSELIFPNIANFNFLFDDTPASPYEFKKYSLNRYTGFYVDLELVNTLTPYRSETLKSDLKIENNVFMDKDQVLGSIMPFNIKKWDDKKDYYVFALGGLYKVVRIKEDDDYYYKIISDLDLNINDITRETEIDIFFNELSGKDYNNQIKTRTELSIYLDILITSDGVEDLPSDLYFININGKNHVIEKRINEVSNLLEHFIRTDYAIKCDDTTLKYWIQDENNSINVLVEDDGGTPITFPIYKVKFRSIKDFDFSRVDTGFANFDFDKSTEYVDTNEEKLYTEEFRDASDITVFKVYDNDDINSDKNMIMSSEYIATDELFEINKEGLTNIWRKNQNVVKWGYKQSISHSDYPYKLNNSKKVGSYFNRTTDVFSKTPNIYTKTHDYFYRIGDFYASSVENNVTSIDIQYYDDQTISIQTELLSTNYFDLDVYLEGDVDYFDYFFKNKRKINKNDYEQTTHYSIINSGDKYLASNTLFKGIKYNMSKVSNIIRDENNKIIRYIIDKNNNYNGYKFSVILNDVYKKNGIVYDFGVKSQDIDTDKNGIHVFVNDKYKNILVVINLKLETNIDGLMTFNDVTTFDQKSIIYSNKITYGDNSGQTAYHNYDPSLLSSYNYIMSINDNNNINLFDDFITYYYIDSENNIGYSKINNVDNNLIDVWGKNFVPLLIECEKPETITTKKQSYTVAAIKGPKFNLYDKYKNDFTEAVYDKSFIDEPLSRYITINEEEISPKKSFLTELNYDNTIYRYNGFYEPIFKEVELYKPIKYDIVNGGNFIQKKCGGFLRDNDYGVGGDLVEIENEKIFSDIEQLQQYITTTQEKMIIATINNDIDEIDKLNREVDYYNNLIIILYNSTGVSMYVEETEMIDKWLFKDNSTGLCDGNYAYCEHVFLLNDTELMLGPMIIGNYNFSIPSKSTISTITLTLERKSSSNNTYSSIFDYDIKFIKPNGCESVNIAGEGEWSTDITSISYIKTVEELGFSGETVLTPQEINNNNFAVSIEVKAVSPTTTTYINTAYIDCVCLKIDYTIGDIETGKTYIYSVDSNTVFDTNLNDFGLVDEIIYSKVNEDEKENPLKIKDTEEDRSIYPMVDEFGYSWDKRFIFKSSWDNDYYTRTKNELDE